MNSTTEKKLAARATELGKSARADAFDELVELVGSASPLVRRLAASAIGKLAKDVLPDLRDLYKSPVEKDYVKRSVLTAGKQIRTAVEIAERSVVHGCKRCGVELEHDEYVRSQKKIRTREGIWVQSDGERRIAELLAASTIRYRYDERFRILDGYAIRPDFYLPEFDVYIEYWGMDTADYKIGMLKKQKLYQQQGKKLVSLYPGDKPHMRETLLEKLEMLK